MCVHTNRGQRSTTDVIPEVLSDVGFQTVSHCQKLADCIPVNLGIPLSLSLASSPGGFFIWALVLNLGLHDCKANTSPNDLSLQP